MVEKVDGDQVKMDLKCPSNDFGLYSTHAGSQRRIFKQR